MVTTGTVYFEEWISDVIPLFSVRGEDVLPSEC